MAEGALSKPEAPTNKVVEIRQRQHYAVWTALIGTFLGVILIGAWAMLAFDWPGITALPTIAVAFPASLVAMTLAGEPYDRHVSRLWKEHNEAFDRYWDQRRS